MATRYDFEDGFEEGGGLGDFEGYDMESSVDGGGGDEGSEGGSIVVSQNAAALLGLDEEAVVGGLGRRSPQRARAAGPAGGGRTRNSGRTVTDSAGVGGGGGGGDYIKGTKIARKRGDPNSASPITSSTNASGRRRAQGNGQQQQQQQRGRQRSPPQESQHAPTGGESIKINSSFDEYFGVGGQVADQRPSVLLAHASTTSTARNNENSNIMNLGAMPPAAKDDDFEIKFLDPTPINSPREPEPKYVSTYAAQPSTISTKNDAFFLRESFEPISNLQVGSKFISTGGGPVVQQGSGQQAVKRPMRRMSMTQSQSPSPKRGGQQGGEPGVSALAYEDGAADDEELQSSSELLSSSLPSPLPAHQQLQQPPQQQQGRREGARGQSIQPTQSAFLGQRNSNKLSSSRVRRADGRTKSNLVNESKPLRSHQRDLQKKNFVRDNASKSVSATAASQRRTSRSQGGGISGRGRRNESSRFLEAQHVSPQRSKAAVAAAAVNQEPLTNVGAHAGGRRQAGRGYTARHQNHKKSSPPPLRQISQAANPSIAMAVEDLRKAETSYNGEARVGLGEKAPPPDFDSLDAAMQAQVKHAPPSGSNIFMDRSEPNSRASTPISDFEEAEQLAKQLVKGGPEKNQKKRLGYKPYTLADYKKNNKPVQLGKLQPDLQTPELIAKREKARKVKEFANNINKTNIKKMIVKPQSVRVEEKRREEESTAQAGDGEAKGKVESSRSRAKEYSKRVSKPVAKRRAPAPGAQNAISEKAAAQKFGDFEGSLYDDESLGFDGAEALEASSVAKDRKRRSPLRTKAESLYQTSVDQTQLNQLDAENESARMQIQKLIMDFNL